MDSTQGLKKGGKRVKKKAAPAGKKAKRRAKDDDDDDEADIDDDFACGAKNCPLPPSKHRQNEWIECAAHLRKNDWINRECSGLSAAQWAAASKPGAEDFICFGCDQRIARQKKNRRASAAATVL